MSKFVLILLIFFYFLVKVVGVKVVPKQSTVRIETHKHCSQFGALDFIQNSSSQTELIEQNGYGVETHKATTTDGYILTLFRITSSSHPTAMPRAVKPVALLQHGMIHSSDSWVLMGSEAGLAYLLADAGYDVWLGNQRGNTYSREHLAIDAKSPDFWNFSWHEIGYYDLAALIDCVRNVSGATAVHFVGYSQGASAMLVLLSMRPEYMTAVNTVQLMAPIAFTGHMQQPLARIGAFWLRHGPTVLKTYLERHEGFDLTERSLTRRLCKLMCDKDALFHYGCRMIYQLFGGTTQHTNESLLTAICETQPAGSSVKQILHFLQSCNSDEFAQFDYGSKALNQKHYEQPVPPVYPLAEIAICIHIYFSDGDIFSTSPDVRRLVQALPCALMHHVQYGLWNHYDFLFSKNVEELNLAIIERMQNFDLRKLFMQDCEL